MPAYRSGLRLTPDLLRAAYDFLASSDPFRRLNMPASAAIAFTVARTRTHNGWHNFRKGRHEIVISAGAAGSTDMLMRTMAHEMLHVHDYAPRRKKSSAEHSTAFRRLAAAVCRVHGFDLKAF